MIERYNGDHNIKDATGDLELLKRVAGSGYIPLWEIWTTI